MAVKKRKWCIGIIMGMFILSVLWIVWGNEALELNAYTITSENRIPYYCLTVRNSLTYTSNTGWILS